MPESSRDTFQESACRLKMPCCCPFPGGWWHGLGRGGNFAGLKSGSGFVFSCRGE